MRRHLFALFVALTTVAGLEGCLFEPEIGDEWTRLDILAPGSGGGAIPDTLSELAFHGRITYRAIRTGDLIVQILVSDSIGYDAVRLEQDAPREALLHDVERVLAGSRAVASRSVRATGWDRLMRDIHVTLPLDERLQHGPNGGVYLVFYMGTADRIENPDGSETTVFEPFDFTDLEILPVGLELRTAGDAAPAAAATAATGMSLRLESAPAVGGELSPRRRTRFATAAPRPERSWQPTFSIGGGAVVADPHLRDYQWSGETATLSSGEVGVRHNAWRTGVRVSRWSHTQTVTGAAPDRIQANQTAWQFALRRRLVGSERVGLSAGVAVGALHVGYAPDHARVDLSGDGADVRFAPLWSLLTGVEVGIHRAVSPSFALGVDLGRQFFSLDTAHRRGDAIVSSRESFGGWYGRGRLTWTGGGIGS